VLLINPANAEYGGTLSRFTPLSLPMSIGCLAAVLRQHGYPAKIWDEELRKIDEDTVEELVEGLPKPYIFGITILTAQVARAFKLVDMLKAKYADCKVIVGGYHPTALPEEALLENSSIDVVVRGEGERTIIELYEAIKSGKTDFSNILGVTFRKDGKIISTPERALIKDLATLPRFPYDMFVDMLERANSMGARTHNYDWGFIVTSRGCPYKCTYCAQRMMTGNTYRWRPIDVVLEELDILINRFGARNIFFLDDNFCFKRAHTIELCERLRDSGLGKQCEFSLQTRADNFYEQLVPIMREAGFTSVGFGMETGTEKLIEIINKGETIEQHIEAINLAKKHGMDAALFMIYGFPTETHKDRKLTYKLCKKLGLTHIKFNNLMPYPGTPMYHDLKKTARFNKVGHWENFTSALSEMGLPLTKRNPLPYVPEESSEIELTRDVIRYNLLVTLRWSVVKGILRRRHGPGWFKLKAQWYLKPAEWFYVGKLALMLLGNLVFSFMPLFILEPILHWRNPTLQRRVPKDQIAIYKPSGWNKESYYKEMA